MKGWVKNFTGEYTETEDNINIDQFTATEVPPLPSHKAKREIKIQKEMTRLLRQMAIDNLGPEPVEPD